MAVPGRKALIIFVIVCKWKHLVGRSVESRPHIILSKAHATRPRVLVGKSGPFSAAPLEGLVSPFHYLNLGPVFQAIRLELEAGHQTLLTHYLVELLRDEPAGVPSSLELLRYLFPQQS